MLSMGKGSRDKVWEMQDSKLQLRCSHALTYCRGVQSCFFSRPHGTFAMHGFIPCSKFERWEACRSFRSLKRQLSYNQTSQIHCCDISNAELPIDILQNCACYHAPFVWPVSVNHSSFAVISLRSDLRMFLGKSNHRSAKYGISSSTMY